jgi:twitching motility protein PilT
LRHQNRCYAFEKLVEKSPNSELFVLFANGLRIADPLAQAALVRLLPRVNNVSKHAELCAVMGAQEPEVRKAAADVMRVILGQSDIPILEAIVAERAFAGRIDVMDMVAAKAGYHGIPVFASVLRAGTPRDRAHALALLSDTNLVGKNLEAARAAVALAIDDQAMAGPAIEALAALSTEEQFFDLLGEKVESVRQQQLVAIISSMKRYSSGRVIEFLTRKFRLGPNPIRFAILDALEGVASEATLPLFLEALSTHRIDVRLRAAEVLARLGLKGVIDIARVVVWLLRSRDPNLRRIAVELVNKAGDASGELTPMLLNLLKDEDWWVRERVMDALVELSGPALTQHLVGFLKESSDVVRRFAIGGLARVKDPRSLGALVRAAMDDADWWVREQAIEVIGQLGDAKAIPYLLDLMTRHPTERLACAQALTALRATDAASRIAELLTEDDVDMRLAGVQCIGKLGARSVEEQIRQRMQDPDFRVRSAAQELVARWGLGHDTSVEAEDELNGLDQLLVAMAKLGADDLIILPNRRPMVKHLNKVVPLVDTVLEPEDTKALLFAHLMPSQVANLAKMQDIDFSHEVKSHGLRFRGHVFSERSGFSAVFRSIKSTIPALEKLGLPPVISTFANSPHGLVLVGGPTGSGKSTTLAALIDYINRESANHILTIEDPVEVVHPHKRSFITQREVGTHTASFSSALKATLRQDPDIILVGELRDMTTISFAVSAAETGHLVFGTMHTVAADTSVDRLINAFPAGQQGQIRSMLASTLRAVVCQHLVRHKDGKGRALAVEVMINNEAIASLIRKGKNFQISSVIQTAREEGMQSMDAELIRLVREDVITQEEGYMKANDKKLFESAFGVPDAAPDPNAPLARPVAAPGGH